LETRRIKLNGSNTLIKIDEPKYDDETNESQKALASMESSFDKLNPKMFN
jgi:hypothetical protein